MKGRIAEVFDSMQGEGLYFGERQIFVRLFGCNLFCSYCDTKLQSFTEYEPQELFEEIKLYPKGFHSISYTGGEPLLQKDFLKECVKLSAAAGYRNYLETNGTLVGELQDVIHYIDIVAMDFKLPTSSGMGNLWGMHRKFLKVASQKEVFVKTIICQATVEEDLREGIRLLKEVNPAAILILQPNSLEHDAVMAEKLFRFKYICLKEQVLACLIPQMHKVVGVQ